MRFTLTPRFLLFAGLCVCLASGELWLRNGLAVQNSRIVFSSTRHGHTEIYVMDADGGNQERLTNNTADDDYPTWSPDRTKIAFISDRNRGLLQIYVMDAHGKHAIRLTDGLRKKGDLDWSPDGRKIAFTSWNGQKSNISVMDADGNNAFKLTDGQEPSWSPDGRTIAFVSGRDWRDQVCVIGVDGNGLERLTQDVAIKVRRHGLLTGNELHTWPCCTKEPFKSMWWGRMVEIAIGLRTSKSIIWTPHGLLMDGR